MSHGTNRSLFSWLSLTSTTIQARKLQPDYVSVTLASKIKKGHMKCFIRGNTGKVIRPSLCACTHHVLIFSDYSSKLIK